MAAPKYVHRNLNNEDRYKAPVFEAVQFLGEYPQSHWHVNCGHPRIALLKDLHWVQTRTGPVQIFDRQYVVLSPESGLSVWNDEDFNATFEPLSEYE